MIFKDAVTVTGNNIGSISIYYDNTAERKLLAAYDSLSPNYRSAGVRSRGQGVKSLNLNKANKNDNLYIWQDR